MWTHQCMRRVDVPLNTYKEEVVLGLGFGPESHQEGTEGTSLGMATSTKWVRGCSFTCPNKDYKFARPFHG